MVCFRGLVQIKECDNLLPINIMVQASAILVDSTVIDILAVEHGQIVVHRAVVSSLTKGVFDDEPLKGEVVWIFPHVTIPIEQGVFLLFKVLQSGIGHGAGGHIESTDVSILDKQRIWCSSSIPFLVREKQTFLVFLLVFLEDVLAVGGGLHLDDVDILLVLVVYIHVAAIGVAVMHIFAEFLVLHIPRVCDESAVEILLATHRASSST